MDLSSTLQNSERKQAKQSGSHFEIPAVGRQSQVDPWGSLAWQSSLTGKLEDNKRPCLKIKVDGIPEEEHLKPSGLPMHTHTCVHTPICVHTHIHKELLGPWAIQLRGRRLVRMCEALSSNPGPTKQSKSS